MLQNLGLMIITADALLLRGWCLFQLVLVNMYRFGALLGWIWIMIQATFLRM